VAPGTVPAGEKVVVKKVDGLQLQVEPARSEQKVAIS
jgi:membrane protein implicated in regulation of membrane protease activity